MNLHANAALSLKGRRELSANATRNTMSRMRNLDLAAIGIALGIVYAIGALVVIALVCFAVVKLLGRPPRARPHEPGAVGAGEEQFDQDDGTPHTTDS